MTFRNSGAGRPLDATHIFERFYQGSKKEGSTGLGLAIADSICKLQHLTLRYYFEKDEHCFELRKNNLTQNEFNPLRTGDIHLRKHV